MTNLSLLPLREAAKFLNLSRHTVRALVSRGELPAVRISARCFKFDPADLRKFVESRRIESSRVPRKVAAAAEAA
jgi:excisionase family DNA binding protein